nr:hypothetical protein [Tanacetum cinerariifolium]
ESDDQELEAHYMYMAKIQQVSPDVDDSGPIFDKEPEQKSEDMNYDSEQIDQNDEDVDLAKERELLASLITKLKCEIDENKNRNTLLETSKKILVEKFKSKIADFKNKNKSLTEANNKLSELYKTREDKDIKKVIDLENKVKVLDYIVYKTGQFVQTMNMLNNKCRTSFAKPEYLKKAK